MPDWKKDASLRKNAVRFIEAAYDIIDAEGLNSLSVRKVAERAGFHNSTIYTYFKDIDALEQLACIRYLAPYASRLSEINSEQLSAGETFYRVWEAYFTEAFRNPQIFYLLFFGKYDTGIADAMNTYYDLFPQETHNWSEVVSHMYFGESYDVRCKNLLKPLAGSHTVRFAADQVDAVNTLIVNYTKGMLEKKCASPSTDNEALTRECLSMLHYIVDRT